MLAQVLSLFLFRRFLYRGQAKRTVFPDSDRTEGVSLACSKLFSEYPFQLFLNACSGFVNVERHAFSEKGKLLLSSQSFEHATHHDILLQEFLYFFLVGS